MSWAARPRAIRILSHKNLNHARRAAEVIAGGEHGIDGVAACVCEVIATHAVMFLEMADDGACICGMTVPSVCPS